MKLATRLRWAFLAAALLPLGLVALLLPWFAEQTLRQQTGQELSAIAQLEGRRLAG